MTLICDLQFAEESGTTAFDSSGHENHFTLGGGDTFATVGVKVAGLGQHQHAVRFDAVTRFLRSILNLDLSGTNEVTVDAFVRWHSTYAATGKILWEHTDNFNSSTGGFYSSFDDTSPHAGRLTNNIKGNTGYSLYNYDRPPHDTFIHFAAVYDKGRVSGEADSVYLNGELQAGANTAPYNSNNTNNFASSFFNIGSRGGGSSALAAFSIASLQINDTALDASAILARAQEGLNSFRPCFAAANQ